MTNIIKIKFIKGGEPSGREYTYFTPEDVAVGDKVDVEQRGGTAHGIVTQVDVPESEIAAFADKAKSIIGKTKEIEPDENQGPFDPAEVLDKLAELGDHPGITHDSGEILPGPADLSTDIIVVRQLPIIEEQLMLIKDGIQTKVDYALSMVCTEDTVKDIKALRSELNKNFTELENKRKEVKSAIMSPYDQFEAVYKSCVTDIFKPADANLKAKIDAVESELKDEKANEVRVYFYEYLLAHDIDFVTFEQTGITVTLTASKTSLKAACKAFIDKVVEELALIDTQECKAEILVEYKKSLNVAQAITTVSNRQKSIAAEMERLAAFKQREDERRAATQKVDTILEEDVQMSVPTVEPIEEPAEEAPAPVTEPVKVYSATFTVTGTMVQLRELKTFLANGGYRFQQV